MRRSRLVAVLLGSLLVLVISSCSSDPESDAPSSSVSTTPTSGSPTPTEEPTETADGALGAAVLQSTLLTTADLPDGFQEGSTEAGAGDDAGCLALTGRLDELGIESAARVRFVAENEVGAAGVLSKVYSDGDLSVLRQALNQLATALRTCKSVDVTDEDGARTQLDVTTDRRPTSDAVERQVNFTATGTVSGAGTDYPYRIRYSVSMVGRTLAVVAGFEVGRSSTDLVAVLPRLGATVVDRLVDAGATD